MLLVAAAALSLCAAGCQNDAAPAGTATAPARAEQAKAPTPAAVPAPSNDAPAGAGQRNIDRIIARDSIGTTKEFLERSLGQSTYETPDSAEYTVDGCDVTLTIKNRAVESISVRLKPACHFDARDLLATSDPVQIAGGMTFAQLDKLFAELHYVSPCLTLCGNAYDPYVDAVIVGYPANGYIDVSGHATFLGDVLDAATVWEDELAKVEDETYIENTKFNCDKTHNDIPRAAFAKVAVESLQFGHLTDPGTTACE
ncbi:hypothetical protein [Lysobacter sp. HA18]